MNQKLTKSEIESALKTVDGWFYDEKTGMILREFSFKSYLKTIAFVNAVAWVANKENHHPDLEVSFNKCVVKLTTHDLSGISENDFNLAKLINETFL